jgi:hypothetical protein
MTSKAWVFQALFFQIMLNLNSTIIIHPIPPKVNLLMYQAYIGIGFITLPWYQATQWVIVLHSKHNWKWSPSLIKQPRRIAGELTVGTKSRMVSSLNPRMMRFENLVIPTWLVQNLHAWTSGSKVTYRIMLATSTLILLSETLNFAP